MAMTISLIRILFFILSILFTVAFTTSYFEGGLTALNLAVGIFGGAILASLLIATDLLFKRFNLRSFNTALLGLFFGYLMGSVILFTIDGIMGTNSITSTVAPLRFLVYLVTAYLGMVIASRSADELHVSIPFVELQKTGHKKKDILIDISVMSDPRIIDLAASGLLDHILIVPRFASKELFAASESGADEGIKAKARRSIEVLKKLESIPTLELRYVDTDFPEIKDPMAKLVRLARYLDTNIITSDINRVQSSSLEGVKIINIHSLSNALKPISQTGEHLNIKIQRFGKEPRQGVGYLDDGTMVVINGGAEFIGETIKAQVLSVKHTSSGRMIFCNAAEEGFLPLGDHHDFDVHSSMTEETPSPFEKNVFSSPAP